MKYASSAGHIFLLLSSSSWMCLAAVSFSRGEMRGDGVTPLQSSAWPFTKVTRARVTSEKRQAHTRHDIITHLSLTLIMWEWLTEKQYHWVPREHHCTWTEVLFITVVLAWYHIHYCIMIQLQCVFSKEFLKSLTRFLFICIYIADFFFFQTLESKCVSLWTLSGVSQCLHDIILCVSSEHCGHDKWNAHTHQHKLVNQMYTKQRIHTVHEMMHIRHTYNMTECMSSALQCWQTVRHAQTADGGMEGVLYERQELYKP